MKSRTKQMVHLKGDLAEKQEIIKQFIEKESMNIADFPLAPRVDAYVTNNFLQGVIARLVAFDDTLKKFVVVKVDSVGNLKTTASVTNNIYGDLNGVAQAIRANSLGALRFDPFGRTFDNFDVFLSEPHPIAALLASVGIDVSGYETLSLNVATTNTCTVTVQLSDDNVNWYEIKTAADADLSWACNNEKINFSIPNFSRFVRVLVQNTAGAAGTTTAVLNAKA